MPSDAKPSRRPSAYAFKIDTTMRELFRRLSADDPWQWIEGDSHWYGDYLGTHPLPHDGVIRIYQEGDRFVLNIRYRSARPDAAVDYQALHETILTRFLPSIGAYEIAPHEGFD